METLGSKYQVARKEHRCTLCEQAIAAGTRYLRVWGKDGPYFWVTKAHPECMDLYGDFYPYDEVIESDAFIEAIRDNAELLRAKGAMPLYLEPLTWPSWDVEAPGHAPARLRAENLEQAYLLYLTDKESGLKCTIHGPDGAYVMEEV